MQKLIIIMTAFFLFSIQCYSQTDWQVLNSGVAVNLYGLYFQNLSTGYVCGASGIMLKTSNSGLNWSPLNSSVSFQLNDICFADNITGYCAGNSGIIKTTNSGINWISVFNLQMNKICFVENIIYAGGQNGIYKSIDSGQTWTIILPSSEGTINGLFFNNSNIGYGMGVNALQRKTTNGGVNWLAGAYWGPYTYSFGECHFFNSDTGFVGYSFNSGYPNYLTGYGIYKATFWNIGGSSWLQVYSSSTKGIGSLTFKGRDTGYAVGGGWTGSQYESLILKTINGGNNWVQQNFVINQVLQDVFFLDSKRGYAVGRTGTILKTETGGVIGIKQISEIVPSSLTLQQNYPNPFNQSSVINFQFSMTGNVKIVVFDVTGKEIITLLNEWLQPGIYKVTFSGGNLYSGVYFYRIVTKDYSFTKKMLLVK